MNIEAKYLNIKWKNKNEIEKVIENFLTEKLEYIDDSTYFLQLYTYVKIDNLFAQIAFHVDDETITPTILLNDGSKQALKKIIDPETNKIWWVEEGEWSNQGKFYESLFINHIGDTKIIFDNIIVDINVRPVSLTEGDVEIILNDFKNELWKLIYSKKSYSSINIKSDSLFTINQEYVDLLKEYIVQIKKFLLDPKSRLNDIFGKEKLNKVKPNQKTFMEYINNPANKYYTSRQKEADYNISENQYVCYTFHFIEYLLSYNIKYQTYLYDSSMNKIKDIKQYTSTLNKIISSKELEVNKNMFLKDLDNKKNIYNKLVSMGITTNKTNDNKRYSFNFIKIEPYMNKYYDEDRNLTEEQMYYYHAKINDEPNLIYRLSNNDFDGVFNNDCLGLCEIDCVLKKDRSTYDFYNYYVPKESSYKFMFYKTIDYINFTVQDDKENLFQNIDIKLIEKKGSTTFYTKYRFDFYKTSNNISPATNNVSTKNYNSIYIPNDNEELINNIEESFLHNKRVKISIYKDKVQEICAFIIEDISSIVPIALKEKIEKLEHKRNIYEANNWIRKFKPKENKHDYNTLRYIEQQKIYSNQRFITENNRMQSYINTDILVKLYMQLSQLKSKFNQLNILSSSKFPNSIVFIQNPTYAKIYQLFNQLLNMQNIDKNTFNLFEILENKITVTDIPHIYEKWCLIVVLNTLIYSFDFKPVNDNWITELANSLFGKRTINIKIEFTNTSLGYDITVFYEKKIASNKIPDIILEIKHKQLYNSYKVVIDAKFHEDTKVIDLINLLYYHKNYSEDYKNSVFVFHPDKNAMEKEDIIVNQQVWGKGSFLGEGILYSQDNTLNYTNHKYGVVCISPTNYDYLFMAQRFIGMCLQYYTYVNIGFKPNIWLCIGCGHGNSSEHTYCDKCGSYVGYTHCYNCGNKLIKNGHFWSYHKYVIDDPYNIDCPNCGANLSGYVR